LPDRIDQFVLADDPIAVADQEEQQIEHLRLDPDGLPSPAQLVPSEIDFKLAESEVQGLALPNRLLFRRRMARRRRLRARAR
jgi:hypothetical protein